MAYIVSSSSQGADSFSSQTMPIDLTQVNYEVDDYVIVCIQTNRPSSTITEQTTALWTRDAFSANIRSSGAIFSRKMTASESNPTFVQSGTASSIHAVIIVVRGAYMAAHPISAAAPTFGSSSSLHYVSTSSITTATDNSLIISFNTAESTYDIDVPVPGIRHILAADNDGQSVISTHSFYQLAAGATPSFKLYSSGDGGDFIEFTIAIRDNVVSQIKGQCDPNPLDGGYSPILPMTGTSSGAYCYGYCDSSERKSNPTTVIPTLDGAATSYPSTDGKTQIFINQIDYPKYMMLICSTSPGIVSYKLKTQKDLSNKLISILCNQADADLQLHSKGGVYAGLMSGDLVTGSARVWKLASADTLVSPIKGIFPYVFDTSFVPDSTDVEDHGTPDLTAIDRIVVGAYGTASTLLYFGYIVELGTISMVGGSEALPASFADVSEYTISNGLKSCQAQGGQTKGQFYLSQSVTIGNGVDDLYWKSENQSVELPAAYDVASLSTHAKISAGLITISVIGPFTSSNPLNNTTINFGNLHKFVVNSPLDSIANAGLNIINSDVTLTSHGGALGGASFIDCLEVNNSIDLSGGCTFSGVKAGEVAAITITSESELINIYNCTFLNNTNAPAILITGDQSGTWSDPNLTVSGNTYDIEYTGTTDFSIYSVNALSVNNSSTGVLTIVTPTASLTINVYDAAGSALTGYEWRLYTDDPTPGVIGTAELAGEETATSSQQVYSWPSAQTAVLQVIDDDHEEYLQTIVLASSDIIVDVNLIKETNI